MSARGDTHLWHPFSDMAAVRGNEFVVERGEGIHLWDAAGDRYIDGCGALWYANIGHGRGEIADAVAAQMRKLEAYSIFGDVAVPTALELADRLAALAPMDDARVFFGMGGGDGTEAAAKLARAYWSANGRPERDHIITRTNAYHGSHGFATSIVGIPANRAGFGPLIHESSNVQWDSPEALEGEIERLGAGKVAAFFMEPVIGAGGLYPPPDGYIETVAELCRETRVLFVLDAVICGFGRVGTWLAAERWGVRPDMIVFAKGITSGYMPLGGVIVSGRVAEPFWDRAGNPLRHGQTWSGHAASCAAALVNLDILEREGLIERGRTLEGNLYDALAQHADHPLVGEVRGGVGLLGAIELRQEVLDAVPGAPNELYKHIRDTGKVMTRPMLKTIAVSPPLTITPDEITEMAEGIGAGLDAMLAQVAPKLEILV